MAWYDYLLGGAGGGASGMFNSFMHPEQGYEDAAKRMEEAWKKAQGEQQPFQQAGIGQVGALTGAENALLDPSKLLADWMSKYQMSPSAQQSLANARESGLDAASSMGLMGSSAALGNIQKSSSDIMNADRQQFLDDLMNKYMKGVGIGQNIYDVGAGAGQSLGQQGLAAGGYLGDMAYGAKNAPGDLFKQMLAMAAKMAMQSGGGGAA